MELPAGALLYLFSIIVWMPPGSTFMQFQTVTGILNPHGSIIWTFGTSRRRNTSFSKQLSFWFQVAITNLSLNDPPLTAWMDWCDMAALLTLSSAHLTTKPGKLTMKQVTFQMVCRGRNMFCIFIIPWGNKENPYPLLCDCSCVSLKDISRGELYFGHLCIKQCQQYK